MKATSPPAELNEFLDTLRIDSDHEVNCLSIDLSGSGVAAKINGVFVRPTGELFLQLCPVMLPIDRYAQHVCSLMAGALLDLAEELNADAVHLCIKKGNKLFAVWMRSCLYVGFSLMSGSRARKVMRSESMVVLRLKLDYDCEKDYMSDGTASTCDTLSSPSLSPASSKFIGCDSSLDLA